MHAVTISRSPGTQSDVVGQVAAGWRVNERVHGYVAEAVAAGPGDVVMLGTNGLSIMVPEDRAVAFDHDAMSLASGAAQPSPWWLPVVRALLIPESVSAVASNPQAADADGDGFTAGEEMRMGSSDGDAAAPGGVRPFLASALAGLGPHVIHDERDAPRPVGDELWGRQTEVSIPLTAEATKRYLSLVVTHRGFPRGTRSAVSDTLTWSLAGGGAALGGAVKASDLHHAWLNSLAGGRTLGGARPFWVIPLGFVADGEATAGVTVTTASARGEWLVAAVLTDDSQALAGVGGRFVAAGAGVPENHVRINDRPAAIPFAERPQISGNSTPSGSAAGFDSDGDFSPDLEEQAAGTNPQDKHSAPVVLSSLIISRHSTRLRPNPPGGRGSTALSINNGWEVDSQFRYLMRAWVVPPGYVNLLGGELFEKSDARFSGDTGKHGGDFADLWDHHAAPLASRGLPSAELGGLAPVALFIGREGRASADGPFWHEEIFTRGMRYHLRGPARLESQERTYIRARWVKEWPSVEAYYRDLMEIGTTWLYFDKTPSGAPTSTSIVKLEIPPSQFVGGGAHYSNSHDVVPELRSIPEKTKGVVLVTERLLPMEVAPEVLAVNTNFDERKLKDGFAKPDAEDTSLQAISGPNAGKIVTTDLHEGFFGLRPGMLPYTETAGAVVKIKKLDKTDPVTGAKQTGHVRMYSVWGDTDSQVLPIELYNPDSLVANDIGPTLYSANPNVPVRYYLEGVKPGKITLEFSYQKGSASFKHEQEFLVCTQKSRADWLAEITEQIKLETGNAVDMSTYNTADSFNAQKAKIQQVYRYYEGLHRRTRNVQRWGGLAKRAGCPVYAGLSDAERGKTLSWVLGLAGGLAGGDTLDFLQSVLIQGGYDIFHDLSWQCRAYERGGYYAVKYVADKSLDTGSIKRVDLEPWQKIAAGDALANVVIINNGTLDLTRREQDVIVQRAWDRVIGVPTRLLDWGLSIIAENPLPGEASFSNSQPSKSITIAAERWPWIDNDILGKWSPMAEANRNALVNDPLVNAAFSYARLPLVTP